MKLIATKLEGVFLITPKKHIDNRGYFLESYKQSFLIDHGVNINFTQDNLSFSKQYVLRGLHSQQSPYGQVKLVRCIQGNIFDVAVDIRINSPSFGQWVGYHLNSDNCHSLLIPAGYAHGFYVTSPQALVAYKVDQPYAPDHEVTIIYNDSTINIQWPGTKFILNEKDNQAPNLETVTNQICKNLLS